MKHSFQYLFLLLFLQATANEPVIMDRDVQIMNMGWSYLEDPEEDYARAMSINKWDDVNLPHTWNALDATDLDPGYRVVPAGIKKTIDLAQVEQNKVYELYFESVNIVSKVYVNGKKAGGHIGGYIGFTVDITDYLKNVQTRSRCE